MVQVSETAVPTAVESFGFPGNQEFRGFFVFLDVDTPIYPGQPIVFSWSAVTASLTLDLGTVSFALYLVDDFGNIDRGAQLYSATLSAAESAKVTPGDFQSNKYSVKLVGDMATRTYRLGTYTLRLVISGTGKDGPYESSDASLVVQPYQVDSTWWKWTVDVRRGYNWKVDNYSVQGDVINRSQFAAVTATATMLETNLTRGEGPKDIGSDQPGALVAPQQEVAISFGQTNFSKNWPWFIPGIFIINGDTLRDYQYQVRLDITDEYNNGYPPGMSTTVLVRVGVSDFKLNASGAGLSLMADAAACLAAAAATICIPAVGAALAAAAAALAAAAQISGAVANDPPVPDPNYKKIFQPHPVTLPHKKELEGVFAAFRAVFDVVAHVEAVGVTESRIAGAEAAGDHDAEKLQRHHLGALRKKFPSLSKTVRRLVPIAAKFAADHKKLTPDTIRKAIVEWQHDLQIRARIQKGFIDSGGNLDHFLSIERFLTASAAVGFVANPSTVIMTLGKWAERLADKAASPEDEHRAI